MGNRLFRQPPLAWIPCLLFPIGYALTARRLAGFEFEYFALSAISVACTGFCVIALRRPIKETIPAWTIFGVLFGAYYLEFYEVVVAPWTMLSFPLKPPIYDPPPRIYFSCFTTLTIALIGFTIAVCIYYAQRRRPSGPLPAYDPTPARQNAQPSGPRFEQPGLRAVRYAWVIACVLIAGTSFLVQSYSMVMGLKQATPLPFHLQGLVVYVRLVMIPLLLLLTVYLGIRENRPRWINAGILLLLLYALSDMLLRASKGTLALQLLGLAMLWMAAGQRVGRREIMFVVGIALATIILFPILEVFRGLRNSNNAVSAALLQSVAQNTNAGGFKGTLVDSIVALTMRLTGTGAVLSIIELGVRPLGLGIFRVLASPLGMQGYITFDVFGVPLEEVGSFGLAPSLIGYFYILGSMVGVGIGMLVFTTAAFEVWNFLGHLKLQTLPVAQAMYLFLLFGTVTEGTLDVQIFRVGPVYVASVILIEALCLLDVRARNRAAHRVPALARSRLSAHLLNE